MGLIFTRDDNPGIKIRISDRSSREAYRVVPDRNDPVILQVEGRLARVLDISAGGFSAFSSDWQVGMRYRFKLNLPDYPEMIAGSCDVVSIDEDGVGRCRFVGLDDEDQDRLHGYVLRRQKRAIKATRVEDLD